jgi:5,5'-dehydrodivanillate O-demethylase
MPACASPVGSRETARLTTFDWDNVLRDIGSTIIPCNWLQILENSLDPVHVEWLHGRFSDYVLERLGRPDLKRRFYRPGDDVGERWGHEKIGFDVFEYGIITRRAEQWERCTAGSNARHQRDTPM